jgi:N-ethylmaleimide reductase
MHKLHDDLSSARITPGGEVYTPEGMKAFEAPRGLRTDELAGVVAEYADAARRAVRAGADGVELHAANGYLLQQFLADGSNTRTDGYGGSPRNRARFVVEVATAAAAVIGADKVGIRVSLVARSTTSPRLRPSKPMPR